MKHKVIKSQNKRGRPLLGSEPRKRMSFTISSNLNNLLKKKAEVENFNVSSLIENALTNYFEQSVDPVKNLNNYINLVAALRDHAKQFGVKKISLFGSVLHGTAKADSDIDLLVEFKDKGEHGFFNILKLEEKLSKVFSGRKIDIRTEKDLSKYFRSSVKNEALVLYEE